MSIEPKIDEKSTKDAEDLFSRTENVIEEHEHNIDKNTNKDKENVIHESATDDFPHISDTYDSYQVDESKEDNGSDKEIEQNVDFSEVPDHNQPLQGSNMEDPSQHVSILKSTSYIVIYRSEVKTESNVFLLKIHHFVRHELCYRINVFVLKLFTSIAKLAELVLKSHIFIIMLIKYYYYIGQIENLLH